MPEGESWTVSTLVGSDAGFADGPSATAKLNSPNGIDIDTQGRLYVADAGNHRIRVIERDGAVSSLAGGGEGGGDGPALEPRFKNPFGVAVAKDGTVYVADTGNHRICRISIGVVSTVAGSGTPGIADGNGSGTMFNSPASLSLDAEGNLLVADSGNRCIRRVKPTGEVITLAGGRQGNVDGPFGVARFAVPNDVAVGADGAYVIDSINHNLRVIDFELGIVRAIAGTGQGGFIDATGIRAKFNSPSGVGLYKGAVLVADTKNHAIRLVSAKGVVTTLVGGEQPGLVEGGAAMARLNRPTDLVVGEDDTIYVADTDNHRIRIIR